MKTAELMNKIENLKFRSAWKNGVKQYALDLLEDLLEDFQDATFTEEDALNGAGNWNKYARGGIGACLIWNGDIAKKIVQRYRAKNHKERTKRTKQKRRLGRCSGASFMASVEFN